VVKVFPNLPSAAGRIFLRRRGRPVAGGATNSAPLKPLSRHRISDLSRRASSSVRVVFLILFIVLFVPSQMIKIDHHIRHLGEAETLVISAVEACRFLMFSFFLYCLCVRSTNRPFFIAVSSSTLYLCAFEPGYLEWCAVLVLLLVDSYILLRSARTSPAERAGSVSTTNWATSVTVPTGTMRHDGSSQSLQTCVDAINLDAICGPYRRIQFSLRIVRAATASVAGTALLFGLLGTVTPFFVHDSNVPLWWLLFALVLISLLIFIFAAAYFFVLRALWRGSVGAAYIVLLLCGLSGLSAVYDLVTSLRHDLIVNGSIWYYVAAFLLEMGLIGALAKGSIIIVKRRKDSSLMRILRHNRRSDWQSASLQLCGIVLPRQLSLKVLKHKSVVLSTVAFCIEGIAYFDYFNVGESLLKFAQSSHPPINPVEGHYLSIVRIACFFLPIVFASTQIPLSLAKFIRNRARRASLQSAEQALREDQRPPVLFLRDFDDDQVSMNSVSSPGYLRLIDPGMVYPNLEEM
jgi:hypothetical protein